MRNFFLLFALVSAGLLIWLMVHIPPDPVKEIKYSLSGGKIPLGVEDSLAIKVRCDSAVQQRNSYVYDSLNIQAKKLELEMIALELKLKKLELSKSAHNYIIK